MNLVDNGHAIDGWSVPSVLQLLGAHPPDKRGWIRCPDPEHMDSNPSCHITPDKRGWRCFACGAHGGILDLIVSHGFAEDRASAAKWLEETNA
jgi:hypothetical protein